jgi:hypothetical protein
MVFKVIKNGHPRFATHAKLTSVKEPVTMCHNNDSLNVNQRHPSPQQPKAIFC